MTVPTVAEADGLYETGENIDKVIEDLSKKMKEAAASLEFEKAAMLRDQIRTIETREFERLSFG